MLKLEPEVQANSAFWADLKSLLGTGAVSA
jgi:hypothetical protein